MTKFVKVTKQGPDTVCIALLAVDAIKFIDLSYAPMRYIVVKPEYYDGVFTYFISDDELRRIHPPYDEEIRANELFRISEEAVKLYREQEGKA